MTEKKLCEICDKPIPRERVVALPHVTKCIECSKKNPDHRPDLNPDTICAQSSLSCQNGFAPND